MLPVQGDNPPWRVGWVYAQAAARIVRLVSEVQTTEREPLKLSVLETLDRQEDCALFG